MSPNTTTAPDTSSPIGQFVDRERGRLYEIRGVDAMEPFLMTVNGDSDLWMFVSSRGAFTAGRVQPDWCVFPYETDDTLHTIGGTSGPITMVRFTDGRIWQPLSPRPKGGEVTQVLRRSPIGDRVEFEETDTRTGVTFRAEYGLAGELGIVRTCTLEAPANGMPVEIELLDGYLRVMPAGVPLQLQQSMSTLVEGYARSEFVDDAGLAIYTLESRISDVAAALEMLYANAIWRIGLEGAESSVTDDALRAFERGEPSSDAGPALGRRGAYLCRTGMTLSPGERERWSLIADARLDHCAVADLSRRLRAGEFTQDDVDRALANDSQRLAGLVNDADAGQATADESACAAHRCNVLFNSMRGGVPLNQYRVDGEAFGRFVATRHAEIAARQAGRLAALRQRDLHIDELAGEARQADDPQLERLALEYLPLTFARRHGDPSRPWNRFRIKIRDDQGEPISAYEGNWRDIFQNWEAMSRAYPRLLPGMIAKFVNASTPDGYNPYRINEHGIDWEKPEPGNEWANIGYWGDHQIIYLLRLLQQCRAMQPDWLAGVADRPIFSYANVPYRLKSFADIAADPRKSIVFDDGLDADIERLTDTIGDDARLVLDGDNEPVLVTLTEKLLVPALAKLSSFVPGGGVWMNTQRPEWNDANNALAGFGLSMVTLYQLRSYCAFLADLFEQMGEGRTPLSEAVAAWMDELAGVVEKFLAARAQPGETDDSQRWAFLRDAGLAAERARTAVYERGPGQSLDVDRSRIVSFFTSARDLCDESIRRAKRSDGLYHAYNVLTIAGTPESPEAGVRHLAEMLEGQVAVLSCGVLSPGETADVLDALAASRLYREDQRAYMLYPREQLPPYLERNVIPDEAIAASDLLRRAAESPGTGLVARDSTGRFRFRAEIESHDALSRRLKVLRNDPAWTNLVESGAAAAHHAFEQTFHHAEFTGRSGRMHKYEGLGSIFWHMHAKLVLAVQECVFDAADAGADEATLARLRDHYASVREGLGFHKTPGEFGAVPHEPYSHTPWNRCAQQPGMSGQVKEGILARYGELGVRVTNGCIRFNAVVLDPEEVLESPATLVGGVEVPAGAVGLTVCGVPTIVRLASDNRIRVLVTTDSGDETRDLEGAELPEDLSRRLFARDGTIRRIEASLTPAWPEQARAAARSTPH